MPVLGSPAANRHGLTGESPAKGLEHPLCEARLRRLGPLSPGEGSVDLNVCKYLRGGREEGRQAFLSDAQWQDRKRWAQTVQT